MKNLFLLLTIVSLSTFTYAQDSRAIVREGVELHDAGDYKGAMKKYKEVLKKEPNNLFALQEASNTALSLKEYKECIAYSNKLIVSDHAEATMRGYMNKGTAYDLMKDYKNSVEAYQEGIRKYPDEYLLYFNLGVTYLKAENLQKAKESLLESLYRNPEHASSNYMLGYADYLLQNRVRSMLALYYFLMLEPSSERSNFAFSILIEQMSKGVEKENDQKININIASDRDTSDPFSNVDFFLSILAASTFTEENQSKSNFDKFYSYANGLATYISESSTKDGKHSPYVQLYVRFLSELKNKDLLKTYCYNISGHFFDESNKWLKNNDAEVSKLYNWFNDYTRHNSLKDDRTFRVNSNKRRK